MANFWKKRSVELNRSFSIVYYSCSVRPVGSVTINVEVGACQGFARSMKLEPWSERSHPGLETLEPWAVKMRTIFSISVPKHCSMSILLSYDSKGRKNPWRSIFSYLWQSFHRSQLLNPSLISPSQRHQTYRRYHLVI